jgi:hypothetical protein
MELLLRERMGERARQSAESTRAIRNRVQAAKLQMHTIGKRAYEMVNK